MLAFCHEGSEWSALTNIRHHRYGPLSYETRRFYSVKPWVLDMCRELLADRSAGQ